MGEQALTGLTFGQLVKQARLARGLSQAELGATALTKAFVSLLERDRARPSAATLRHLAERLDRSLADFLAVLDARAAERALADLDRQAQVVLGQRRYGAAEAAFTELRDLAAARGSVAAGVSATLGLGEALLGFRRLQEAGRLFHDALEEARRLGDRLMECRALTGLGLAAHRRGELNAAVELYRAALGLIPTLPKPAPVLHGELLLYLSTMLFRLGNIDESRTAALESLALLGAHASPRTAEVHMNLGMTHYLVGDYAQAAGEYREALRIAEHYEDLRTIFWVRRNLAMVLIEWGQPGAALEHLTVSVTMARRLSDVWGECQALTELGRCQFALGALVEARAAAEEAVGRSHAAGLADEVARANIVLGAIGAAERQPLKALRYLSGAYRHAVRAGMTYEAIVAGHILARLTSRWGRPAEAVRLHDEVFAALRGLSSQEAYGVLRMTKTFDGVIDPALEPVAIQVS